MEDLHEVEAQLNEHHAGWPEMAEILVQQFRELSIVAIEGNRTEDISAVMGAIDKHERELGVRFADFHFAVPESRPDLTLKRFVEIFNVICAREVGDDA